MLGQNGVSLRYFVRVNPCINYNGEDDEDYGFEHLSLDCAPFSGLVYRTDAHKVQQPIRIFLQGANYETWIKAGGNKQDGRVNFKSLQVYYGGEGKKDLQIK